MRLSLIGMAGSGKSFWSRKLEIQGFRRFCCDDMIAERLLSELKNPDGTPMSVADWMGFPYEARYREREARYLSLEAEVLGDLVDYLEMGKEALQENIVVDTTGSVIYMDEELLKRLSRLTTMVLLWTPSAVQKRLLEAYISRPHPMVWKDMFSQKPGESPLEALARCYPDLFALRAELYRAHAHVLLQYYDLWRRGFGTEEFLGLIAAAVRNSPDQVP